jgi:hypothetical protein
MIIFFKISPNSIYKVGDVLRTLKNIITDDDDYIDENNGGNGHESNNSSNNDFSNDEEGEDGGSVLLKKGTVMKVLKITKEGHLKIDLAGTEKEEHYFIYTDQFEKIEQVEVYFFHIFFFLITCCSLY